MHTHWHTYTWDGLAIPTTHVRARASSSSPPFDPADWLAKPFDLHRAVLVRASDAESWLNALLTDLPALAGQFGRAELLSRTAKDLDAGRDVTWRYRTHDARHVIAAAVRCPRLEHPCPTGHFTPSVEPCRSTAALP
ncbi:hypothetical protein ABT160_13960 [Streptomyces sp. NPDC001941]|uniref:hypothetical protein n=1 Tax=Streptomyces sp. NPDC001941 TaxID=3154659 RepID=UPI00332AB4B6